MLLVEQTEVCALQLVEDVNKTGVLRFRGEFGRVDVPTANGRRYPRKIFESALKALEPKIKDRIVLGELDHPADGRASLFRISHLITDLKVNEDGVVIGECEALPGTPGGDILIALQRAKVNVGVSSRGTGSVKRVEEGVDEVQDDFVLQTYDFVIDPAMKTAFPKVVSEAIANMEAPLTEERIRQYSDVIPSEYRSLVLSEMLSQLSPDAPELAMVLGPLREAHEVEVSALRTAIEECNAQIASLVGEQKSLTEGNEAKVLELESRITEAQSQLEGKTAELADVLTKLEKVTQDLGSMQTKLDESAQVSADLERISAEIVTLKESAETQVQEQVAARMVSLREEVTESVRQQIQRENDADPRNALGRKILEHIAIQYAPLVAGPHSPLIQERDEQIRALRDALLRAEYDQSVLASRVEGLEEKCKKKEAEAEKAKEAKEMAEASWRAVASHPKADTLRDLIGEQVSEEGIAARVKKLFSMKEFGTPEAALESLVLAKAAALTESAVEKAMAAHQENLAKLQEEIDQLQAQLEESENSLETVSADREQTVNQLQAAMAESVQYKQSFDKAVEAGRKALEQLQAKTDALADLQEQIEELQGENELLESKLLAFPKIMGRSDRLLLADRLDEATTIRQVNSVLNVPAPRLEEEEARPRVTPRRRTVITEDEVAPKPPPVTESEDSKSPFDRNMFDRLMK